LSKFKEKNKKPKRNTNDGIQVLNNSVKDAHPIETPTLVDGLFGIDIKNNLIDPDTKFYI